MPWAKERSSAAKHGSRSSAWTTSRSSSSPAAWKCWARSPSSSSRCPTRTSRCRRSKRRAASCAGASRPGIAELEWCDRRLLARIHRYTLNRLRAEIEPVSAADFLRFLLHWQHVAGEDQVHGVEGLAAVVEQLEGFELAAAGWENDVLPARVADYGPSSSTSSASAAAWRGDGSRRERGRRCAARRSRCCSASTPTSGRRRAEPGDDFTSEAKAVREALEKRGASFFHELVKATGPAAGVRRARARRARRRGRRDGGQLRRPARAARAAGEAPDAGRDGRALGAAHGREERRRRSGRAHAAQALRRRVPRRCCSANRSCRRGATWCASTGGWKRAARSAADASSPASAASSSPPRMRSAGCARCARRRSSDELVVLSAVDPLNLVGILTPEDRVPAISPQPHPLSRRPADRRRRGRAAAAARRDRT